MTDITLVIPTMNEQEGIGDCIDKAKSAFEELGMNGEIIISDSSTDQTPEIAREKGAKVVEPDKPGYGYAYRYAFERAEGDLIAMGDGDTTYDFSKLPELIQKMREENADMVMGSRLEGNIKPGSMPKLHKYIGNPLLTKFLNKFYGSGVSDAHSGMRVIKKDSLEQLDLKTDGMEFASEMIMEAGARDLKIVETPITYHERKGDATLHSFRDGWRHVKFMLKNAPGYLFFWPGLIMIFLGLLLGGVSILEIEIKEVVPGINSLILALLLGLTGYQAVSYSVFTDLVSDPVKESNKRLTQALASRFNLEKGLMVGGATVMLGAAYSSSLLLEWHGSGYSRVPSPEQSLAAFAMLIIGIQIAFNSFFISILPDEF